MTDDYRNKDSFSNNCIDLIRAFYSKSSVLTDDKDRPQRLKGVCYEKKITGKDVCHYFLYEEVMLAKQVAETKHPDDWRHMKQWMVDGVTPFIEDRNKYLNSIKKSIYTFSEILKYIIDNNMSAEILDEKTLLTAKKKLFKVFGIKATY